MKQNNHPRDKRESGLFRFFVHQSVFINILYLAVIIVGLFLWVKVLNREAFGNFDFDIVQITTPFPGATAEEVEQLVTLPLENAIKPVEGIDELWSVSVEGMSIITVQLDPDSNDSQKIVRTIEREVDRIRMIDLPDDGDEPIVREITAAFPVVTIGVFGELSEWELRKAADELEDVLEDIDGVSRIEINGYKEKQIWVEADVNKLNETHLSLLDLINRIRQADHTSPGGRLDIDGREIIIRTLSRLQTIEDVERVVLRSNEQGNAVLVKDVAMVAERLERERRFTRFNTSKAIELHILKKDSGDTLKITDQVKEEVNNFKENRYPKLQFAYANEIAFYINRRLNVMIRNGTVGLFLVLIIMILFLKPQSAFWSTTAIPFAFLGGIITMYLAGLTINLLSMFAFILVGGMLVDNGIVVAEYIERKREEGLSPFTAASVGISEMSLPVFGASLTTILAFAPLAFMSGITGKFLRQMPLVLVACLIWDLIECLFILPGHLYHYNWKISFPRFIQSIRNSAQKGLDALSLFYGSLLWRIVYWPKLTVTILCAILAISLSITGIYLKRSFFPNIVDMFVISFENPVGTTLEKTERIVKELESIVYTLPKEEIEAVVSQVGSQGDQRRSNSGTNVGEVRVYLNKYKSDRIHGEILMEQIRGDVEEYGQEKNLVKLDLEKVRGGPPSGRAIELLLIHDEYKQILILAEEIKTFLKNIKGTIGISDDYDEGKEEIRLVIDQEATARAGLTTAQLASVVRAAFDGFETVDIKRVGETDDIPVLVKLPESARERLSSLDEIRITTNRGNLVPLKSLIKIERGRGILRILRNDAERTVTISGEVDSRKVTPAEVNKQLEAFLQEKLTEYPGVRYKFSGEKKNQDESNQSLKRAFLVALVLIYLVLATLFRSYWDPIIILSVIPFGLLGIFLALLIPGKFLTLLVWIGAAGLMGVVINNSILMVDTFNRVKRQVGGTYKETVIQGARQRLRPILLTSLSTFFGVMPLGYGIGGQEPFLEDMAYAFGWGLLFCSVTTLLWIPAFFMSSMQTMIFFKRTYKFVFLSICHPVRFVRKHFRQLGRMFFIYFLGMK
ncbi:hypothetical protein BVX98_06445 [bacterium F11]|nr:hypothetical protein BVX98_06445 [bacterium F11]